MGKRNKSKRFIHQSKNAVSQHDQRIPYHTTYADAIAGRENKDPDKIEDPTLGGF